MIIDDDALNTAIENAESTQWNVVDDVYFPSMKTVESLPAGYYIPYYVYGNLRYLRQELSTDGVFQTDSANAGKILGDFNKFWKLEEKFREYNLPYKRGFFLSGPPGSGKTCILKLMAMRTVEMGGVVFDIRESPGVLSDCITQFRSIHKNRPILLAMEDLDKYYTRIHENLLNVMDGMIKMDKVVFVATTNYPENFDDSLINRPGRFDGHYQITPPGMQVRLMFIKSLLVKSDLERYPILQWAKDTKGLPFGHIKELIVSVVVLNNGYGETLERIHNMSEGVSEECIEEEEEEGRVVAETRSSFRF